MKLSEISEMKIYKPFSVQMQYYELIVQINDCVKSCISKIRQKQTNQKTNKKTKPNQKKKLTTKFVASF